MGGDEGCPLEARRLECGHDALVDRDVALETECECVCGQIRIRVIVRELQPLDEKQAVLGEGALRFCSDCGAVSRPSPGVDGPRRRIVQSDGVIGTASTSKPARP
jgi:hypothetical protein